jgi:hypothetical protein
MPAWAAPGDLVSEAALDHALGAAEDILPTDGARPLVRGIEVPTASRGSIAPPTAVRQLHRAELSPFQRWFRHLFSRTISKVLLKSWFRVTIVGRDRIGPEPALYVFNHLSWMDPLALLATFPTQPRLHFYGPKEVTIQKGFRNRFM